MAEEGVVAAGEVAKVGHKGVQSSEASSLQASSSSHRGGEWLSWRLVGPGLLVCLADTDAGCLIVAAQSGARWGYSLLILQILLIPVLFLTQELTVRLGIYTRQGHTACIRQHFGPFWAWFTCAFLALECIGAMISEMSGIAAIAELWGMSRIVATIVSAGSISAVVVLCKYRHIEVIGVVFGLFELVFVLTMFMVHPSPSEVLRGALTPHNDPKFVGLIAANIGAVIMPWMIYFQQSAVVARRLTTESDLKEERTHTLIGSVLTQLVMIGTLVTLAAVHTGSKNLENVRDIVGSLEPVLGAHSAKILVSLGFVGGSVCAAFVVSLAAAWALCEATGSANPYSLDESFAQAPYFYSSFLLVMLLGTVILLGGVNIVKLNIFVEFMDGVLMPMAVGFLFLLATGEALPPEVRLYGWHKWATGIIFALCSVLSISSAAYSLVVA